MLRFLSRQKRSRDFILLLFVGLMTISLITFFSVSKLGGSAKSGATVAKMDGAPITLTQFKERLSYFSSQDPDFRDSNTLLQLKARGADKSALDGLIQEKVTEIEAQRLGLTATPPEVRERLRQVFSEGGKFIGEERYKRRLASANRTWEQFESSLASSITTEKLRNFITAGITVSPQEVEDEYKRQNTTIDLQYAIIKPSDVRDKVTVNEPELRPYFDAHKADFVISGEQRKVDYIYINQSAAAKLTTVPEEDLHKRYDSSDQITRVHLAQIVLKILSSKDDKVVKDKADELVRRARGAAGTKAEDFAALARGNSQDPGTAAKGGDAGWIQRDRNHPEPAYQKAFSLGEGSISDPIKEGNKYYILKVLGKYKQTFDEARAALQVTAQNDLSYRKASQIADEAAELLKSQKDAQKVADAINKKYSIPSSTEKVAEVRQTPFFSNGDQLPDIGSNPGFEDATSSLKKGEVGVKVGVKGGFAIPLLTDNRGAHEATFEEVKSKVEDALKSLKAKDLAEKVARDIASKAKDPDSLKSMLQDQKLKAQTHTGYKKGVTLVGLNVPGVIDRVAFFLKEKEVAKEPVKAGDDWVVLGITKRVDPDMAKFATERKTTQERLIAERQNAFFQAYIDKRLKELKEQGKVVTYQEVIDDFFSVPEVAGSDNEGATPPPKPGTKPVKIPTH